MRLALIAVACVALCGLTAVAQPAASSEAELLKVREIQQRLGEERHSDYYYPAPKSFETYDARARALPDSDRDRRIGFIVAFNRELAGDPYPQRFAIFAKGSEAEKLIIVGLEDQAFSTLFRARGVLATLTSRARASPFFTELGVENLFTFFDLAKLLGFTQVTVSDGRDWAHRVWLK